MNKICDQLIDTKLAFDVTLQNFKVRWISILLSHEVRISKNEHDQHCFFWNLEELDIIDEIFNEILKQSWKLIIFWWFWAKFLWFLSLIQNLQLFKILLNWCLQVVVWNLGLEIKQLTPEECNLPISNLGWIFKKQLI